ncbi:putative Type VI secretion system effector (Hcp1 family) [Xenorhabdus nematophila str. Anatoliense]|nr:putative Type VI secretion system effector (Hcp1 family) [Xenorhabdus nematophila str. Anatoliense]CEE95212.1 putative Type VI secretion system effector (Hcp1 family) [Xenorhabdus nematophila str. Anatoliense]
MSTAGIDAFINFTNVTGESGDDTFKEWTAVKAFSLEVANSVNHDNQGTGLGSGIVDVSKLSVELLFDKAAITLRQYIVKGTHINDIKLNVRRQGGKQETWYSLVLTNALVSKSLLTYEGGLFHAAIELAFQKHKESYCSQEYGSGSKGAEISYEWDAHANKGG